MDNLDSFQTLLEILGLLLGISTQSPILAIVAAIGVIFCLLAEDNNENGNN